MEDRLTPSGWQGLDLSNAVAIAPQVITDQALISYSRGRATPVSGGYVTLTTASATAEGVAVGADGSVYVTGLVNNLSTDQHLYVKKYDSFGAMVYYTEVALFSVPGSSAEGTGIAVDGAGDTYVSGKAHNAADGSDYGTLLMLDPTGATIVYVYAFGSGLPGAPASLNGVAIDTAGDVGFVGQYSPSPAEHDLLVGTTSGVRYYSFGPGTASSGNAIAMSGVSVSIAGWVNLGGPLDQDVLVAQVYGSLIHAITEASPGVDSLNAIALDTAGKTYVAGTLDIGGPTQSALVAKIDPTLTNPLWTVTPATTAATANGIAVNAAGDVIVTGADASGQAYITLLSGVDGSTLDYTIFGGTGGSDVGQAVAIRASDGHVFDVGTTNSLDFPVTDGSTLNGTTDGFLTEWSYP